MFRKTANLASRPVRYFDSGSGTPLVLLHAFPLSADQWLPLLSRVPPGRRVIAPDLRGFGTDTSALDVEGMSMDAYASDVLELMSHLDIKAATVCGLSMGGYVAFAMIRRAPQRVTGLVLSNTRAGADTAEGKAGRDRMIALIDREGVAGVAREMTPKVIGETARREQPDLVDALTRLIEANHADGVKAAVYALKNRPDSTPLLASITCPTLIIVGDEDTLTPVAFSEEMHRGIAGSRLLVLPRTGHLSNLEQPFAFAEAVWSL